MGVGSDAPTFKYDKASTVFVPGFERPDAKEGA